MLNNTITVTKADTTTEDIRRLSESPNKASYTFVDLSTPEYPVDVTFTVRKGDPSVSAAGYRGSNRYAMKLQYYIADTVTNKSVPVVCEYTQSVPIAAGVTDAPLVRSLLQALMNNSDLINAMDTYLEA